MNRTPSIAAVLLLAAGALGVTPSPKSKAHGLTAAGTVTSVEEPAKKMVVKTPAGRQVTLVWTSATKTFGGSVRSGVKVTVRYLEKDGKNIATSIRIEPDKPPEASTPAAAAATPTAAATNSPDSR